MATQIEPVRAPFGNKGRACVYPYKKPVSVWRYFTLFLDYELKNRKPFNFTIIDKKHSKNIVLEEIVERQKNISLLESRSIDYIPVAERHGKVWHLWPVWFSGDAHLATVATGIVGVALGGNLIWTSIAVILGGALGTFFMAFHSTQGPQLGLPQMIQSRPQFGFVGALLVWVVALICYIGYTSFNQILAAQAVQSLWGGNTTVIIIVFTVLSLIFATIGYKLIHISQRIVAYVMIAALVIFTISVPFMHIPAVQYSLGNFKAIPFISEFFAAAAYQLSWSIYVSDYSRYLPVNVSVRASFWWTFLGAFVGGAWMMLVGTVAATIYPKLDVPSALQTAANAVLPGFGKPLLLVSLLGLITVTSLNIYGASLTFLSMADSINSIKPTTKKRIIATLLAVVIASLITIEATGNFITEFGNFLSIILYLFTPWTAINLIDFYVVRKGHYSIKEIFNKEGMYKRWNWRGLSAYGIGFIAMIPFFSTSFYTGPIATALGGADISMIIGLPVAAGFYYFACKSMDLAADRQAAHNADIGLDADILDQGVLDGHKKRLAPGIYGDKTTREIYDQTD